MACSFRFGSTLRATSGRSSSRGTASTPAAPAIISIWLALSRILASRLPSSFTSRGVARATADGCRSATCSSSASAFRTVACFLESSCFASCTATAVGARRPRLVISCSSGAWTPGNGLSSHSTILASCGSTALGSWRVILSSSPSAAVRLSMRVSCTMPASGPLAFAKPLEWRSNRCCSSSTTWYRTAESLSESSFVTCGRNLGTSCGIKWSCSWRTRVIRRSTEALAILVRRCST